MPETVRLSRAEARAVCLLSQGLPAAPRADLLKALEATGFVRTLGGVDAYLAVRARVRGLPRADLDAAVARGDLKVLPAVRGCMYVVSKRDAPAALAFAGSLARARDTRDQEKAGLRKGEVERVADAVAATLSKTGPSTTDAIRRALPEGTLRSLGEAGKKVGVSSALGPALRRLEFAGRVERTPEGGRLDTERYLWRAAGPGARPPAIDAEAVRARVAEIFLGAAGLGTLRVFAAWTGLSQRDAKAAVAALETIPVEIEGEAEPHLALASRRALLEKAKDAAAAVALLPFEDNLAALHGGPALFVDAAHHAIEVPNWGAPRTSRIADAKHMMLRAFVADGKLAGGWEYDPERRTVVWAPFDSVSPAARKALDALADETGRFLADELGHGRSYSLDTDEALAERAALLRADFGRGGRRGAGKGAPRAKT